MKKLLTGLFRSSRKRLSLTHDNDMGAFREKINQLVEQKDGLSDEEIGAKVDELKVLTEDLPDEEGKAKLDRFLEDFRSVKEQDANVAKDAGARVADLFEELDTKAMQDTPETATDGATEEEAATEEVTEETEEATDGAEEDAEEEVETTEAPAEDEAAEEKETADEDPNPDYSMEEIYQFVKKRMAEDAAAEEDNEDAVEEEISSDDGEEVTEEAAEEDEDVVTDHAPFIPVTIKGKTPAGSLAAMFAKAKGEN